MCLDMGRQLVLFSFLVTSALVDSFPYPEGNIFGAFQPGVQSDSVYFQPNPVWSQNQVIPQSTPNPVIAWDSNNNKQLNAGNNFGISPNVFGNPQRINSFSIENLPPVGSLQNGYQPQWPNVIPSQQSTPAPISTNNGFSEVSWNNQRLDRPQQTYFGQPYNANRFIEVNPGSYGQPYQTAGPLTPKLVGFDQAWIPQNQQSIISSPQPVEPWPKTDNENSQSIEFKYLSWPKPDNEKAQPTESTYLPWPKPVNEKAQPIEPKHLPWPKPDVDKGQPTESKYSSWPKPDNEKAQLTESTYLPWPKPVNEKAQPIEPKHLPWPKPDVDKGQPTESKYLLWPKPDSNEKSQPIEPKPWPSPDIDKGQPAESKYLLWPKPDSNENSQPIEPKPWPKPDVDRGQPTESKYLLWPQPDSDEKSQPIEPKPWPKPDFDKGQSTESKYLLWPKPDNNEKGQPIEPKHSPWPKPDVDEPQPTESKYLLWPKPDNEKEQPIESKYLSRPKSDDDKSQIDKSNLLNQYNTPPSEIEPINHLGIPPGPLQSNGQPPIVRSQQPVNNQKNILKNYILVHMNGTYEHVNNLDDIEMDKSNIVRIISKEPPNNILNAIIEVEDDSEFDKQMSLQVPYDTGITKIPRDTERNQNYSEYLSTLKSYEHPDFTKITTEDPTYFDIKYFDPEYIMPIQSTTENNSTDSTTNPSLQTTTLVSYIDTNENNSQVQSTTENTYIKYTSTTSLPTDLTFHSVDDKNTESTKNSITKSTTEISTYNTDASINRTIDNSNYNIIGYSTNNVSGVHSLYPIYYDSYDENTFNKMQKNLLTKNTNDIFRRAQIFDNLHDYKDTDYNEKTKYNSLHINTNIISQEDSRFISKDEKENIFDDHDTIPVRVHTSDSHTWNLYKKGNGHDLTENNHGLEETPNNNDTHIVQTGETASASATSETIIENKNYTETSTEKDHSPVIEEQNKLREDLRIDVSELKTTVKGPVVWFKANKTLWDNITKGENAFDSVSIYDVKCKPKLIDRVTKIHHYPNGTEIVEYAEIIWDSADAVNPKEIKSKREIRESMTSD